MRVAIVGGGLAGLVAAHELLGTGTAVTLLEERPDPILAARSVPAASWDSS
jgi:2-polyprenyl-6-methoxyphenol hydroxylase-like FAD-dependent oxidoreductase